MKNTFRLIVNSVLAIMMVLSVGNTAYAQTNDYTLLAPIPEVTGAGDNCTENCKTTFEKYLPGAFNLAIGVAAVMAFVMITIGGFTYATSDAIQGKSQGKEWIQNALWGLLLVIGAYVILFTINPKILEFDLNIERPEFTPPENSAVPVRAMTTEEIAESNAVKAYLRSQAGGGIFVYGPGDGVGPCTTPGVYTGCVNLNGLTDATKKGLKQLAADCKCTPVITGGTEGGHTTNSAHYTGNAVDLSAGPTGGAIGAIVIQRGETLKPGGTYHYNGASYYWEPKGCTTCEGTVISTGDHWHVTFGKN